MTEGATCAPHYEIRHVAPTGDLWKRCAVHHIGVHAETCKSSPKKEVRPMQQLKLALPIPPGYTLIFRAYKTLKNGTRIYAKTFGYRAFPMIVKAA